MSVMEEPKRTPKENKTPPKQKKIKTHDIDTKEKKPLLFRKKRGGVVLTKAEIREIKEGRKKLRKELRKVGERSRKEFELTASSLGLYFDKAKPRSLLAWLFATKGGWLLLFTSVLLIMAIAGFALLAEMKGHFTISMSDEMFKEGFTISEDPTFLSKTSHLFATPAVDVPCISIVDIPENVNEIDGEHNGKYFAYTFYLRNEGSNEATYRWEIRFNSESQVAEATWMMLFVDDEMTIYAKAADDGREEALPSWETDNFGYLKAPMYDKAQDKSQYDVVAVVGGLTYWRVVPKSFEGDGIVAAGEREDVQPGEVHKYTIVVWLEGDDPDCTNELIGQHIGFEMFMQMVEKENESEQ